MKRLLAALMASSCLAFAAPASASDVFDYTGQIVTWIVPQSGIYDITGFGAQGGGGTGGLGAEVGGDIQLFCGEVLQIVVGQQGVIGPSGNHGGGGGGGTWLYQAGAANPILVAGGGGGPFWFFGSGGDGQATSPGNGTGGQANGDAGGGAGWLSGGAEGTGVPRASGNPSWPSGSGGMGPGSFAGGTTVGALTIDPLGGAGLVVDEVSGGFGGGGGAGYNDGGGGGGYTGGGAGEGGGGGGGTSYLDSGFTNTIGLSGTQLGNGELTISEVEAVPEPGTWALMLGGLGLLGLTLRRQRVLIGLRD